MLRSLAVRPALVVLSAVALIGAVRAPRPAPADLPPPGPRATPPDGTVLFASDFHSAGLKGWTADRGGVWTISHGALRARLPVKRQLRSFIYAGSEEWHDYAVDLDVCQMRGVDKGVAVRVRRGHGVGIDLRGPGHHDVLLYSQRMPLGRAPVHNDNGIWHHLRVEALGGRYRVIVDGRLVLERGDSQRASPRGRIALPAYTGGDGHCTVYYDNVVVTALP